MYTIYIFRRDLRIQDNLGFNYAMENCSNIIPIFIFTPEQVVKNEFKSENAIEFMIESLKELDLNLKKYNSKLYVFQGDNIKVLKKIISKLDIENIVFNQDYTPYAKKRDLKIEKLCKKNDIKCHMIHDYLLAEIGTFLKKDGNPYTVFTPFRNNALKEKIDKPKILKVKNLANPKLKDDGFIEYNINTDKLVKGGRDNGLKQLAKIKKQKKYNDDRNSLSIQTSLLSAYIKFGNISIREVYWKIRDVLGIENDLISQLFWREFYFYITNYFPEVLQGKNFNPKYDDIEWNNDKKYFKAWCEGKTGVPVVDAGMRELNKTGYMHNRARLITSNYLNRILGCDWRLGEKYYASKLTDYDPAVNNGNWQWIASTGTDPKPYFQRLFNPWLQSKKSDKDCLYIKKWVPELESVPNKEIHEWEKYCDKYDFYMKPIRDYKEGRGESVKMYKAVL
uniref:FAD binding domain of DNA photolyase n=1 Tax=Mimiviridae sp. ChoanoV1 TaxID=2596887 RepID=A0A5B8IIA7_9VIRU|nr:FAD binding domain of DNA photolyase [Mimiviridae sp. ChoanoV1]